MYIELYTSFVCIRRWGAGLDGEAFLGRLWMVFFLGGRGRGRGNSRTRTPESFFAGRRESPNIPFFMLYIIYWAVGVSLHSSVDNSTTSSTHWRQWRDCYTSFLHGLHWVVGMVSYAHAVYVTCYFCYMFSLGPSSARTGSVQIYRSVYELYTPYICRCIPT